MSSPEMLSPVESGRFIAANSDHIRIDEAAIVKMAKQISVEFARDEKSWLRVWQHPAHPQEVTSEKADWVFLIDLLNFSFWSSDPTSEFGVEYNGVLYTDYFGLCAAIKRAHEEGLKLSSPSVYSKMTYEEFAHAFRSNTSQPIPLLKERFELVKEAGQTIVEAYDGSFSNCIKESKGSAQALISTIVKTFPSFKDEAEFKSRKVLFYKRAQILVADLWSFFNQRGLGEFHDIGTITMFADYRVPQILRQSGVLVYDEELAQTLEKGAVFQSGDAMEVEIRGNSIWAVELIKQEIKKLCPPEDQIKVNSILIDFHLWNTATDKLTDNTPGNRAHKIRSFFY
eukprot:m.309803 g.309803  ORF g.309803 m.309803 type:complete len:341 (+) comp47880_c0_seq1:132-1154(+)